MTRGSSSTWQGNDCLVAEGDTFKANILERTCGYTDFIQYVQDYTLRLEKAADRMDDSVDSTKTQIQMELRDIVDKHVTQKILSLVDGADCKFLGEAYHQVVDGLCFQAARGMSEIAHAYTALGCLSLFVIVFLYFIWRRSADNLSQWKPVEGHDERIRDEKIPIGTASVV